MKKIISMLLCICLCVSIGALSGCDNKEKVVIYSSMEDFRNEKMKEMLEEKFPDLKIDIQYLPSGNNAAKIKAEGTKVEADIVMDIDYGYMQSLSENFANLEEVVDLSVFLADLVPSNKKYVPLSKFSVGIIVNESALNGKAVPTSYDDLTNVIYDDLIVMPNPTASGTGYGFLKGMVALKGETEAFEYFDKLEKNIKQFSSSGSGPVNSLVRGEAAIGIGMIFQAVQEIGKGSELTILDLEGGTPYNLSGFGIIDGREANENVVNVFKFIAKDFLTYDKVNYMPEQIFVDQPTTVIKDYPNVTNMDMKGFDPAEKESLLAKWKY